MITNKIFTNLKVGWPLLLAGMLLSVYSSCNVVVPRLAPANVFGYATSGELDPEEPYAVGGLQCKTELYPNAIFTVEAAAPPAGYLGVLSAAYPAWTFGTAATSLGKSAIEIKTYDAIGTSTRVGVWIHALYVPQPGDPTDSIHWVQVLTTNHGLGGTGHGPIVTYLDNATGATSPYYDDGYAADNRNLLDRPSRTDAEADHTWEATTFLVKGPPVGVASGNVTLLGPGFTWGWKNTCEATDGLQEYFYFAEKPERFELPNGLEPGGKLVLRSGTGGDLAIGREKETGKVAIGAKAIEFTVEKKVDLGGMSALGNCKGSMRISGYSFQGKQVPETTAEIVSGEGFIQWETGEASLQYVVKLPLPGEQAQEILFHATGLYNAKTKTFQINDDLTGFRQAFLKSNVPVDTKKDKERR